MYRGETVVQDKFDMVIASDCIYENEELWKKFATTLDQVADSDTEIILGHELRSQKDLAFWKHIPTLGFEFEKVDSKDLDPFWQAEEIGVFHVRKKRSSDAEGETDKDETN